MLFKNALMSELRNKMHALPKADFHHHLHLGGNIQKLKALYNYPNISIPKRYSGLKGMIDFIEQKLNTMIRTSDDIVHLMDTAIKNCIDDNVRYLEASVDINLSRFLEGSLEQLVEIVGDLKHKYKSHLDFRPDIGINKDMPVEKAHHDVLECIASEVFLGIDIYGREVNTDLSSFQEIYRIAKDASLKTKVHIGEFSAAHTIDRAIQLLEPDEIQHGIRAIDSEKTMDEIVRKGIQLNVCPQSNVALGAVNRVEDHPIRKLYDRGVKVTVNSDDFLLFEASITDQYVDLVEKGIFSFEEIENMNSSALNAFGEHS